MIQTAPILHVGEDICYRIPVMEVAGLLVYRAACSVEGVCGAFSALESFSSLIFQADLAPVPAPVLSVARSGSAPLVLFESVTTAYDPESFDFVIPHHTPPETWLQILQATVTHSRELHAYSRRLREESANARTQSAQLRAKLHRLLRSSVDMEGMWRANKEP